jgi:8-oxo-dGTP pyrophosphatase MutT (NUDIX family)
MDGGHKSVDAALADRMFVESRVPLTPDDAVAALIQPGKGRYLMQLRDPLDWIFFPGHWGLFGGAIEKGENDIEALQRELEEELSLKVAAEDIEYFTRIDLDFSFAGREMIRRDFFRIEVDEKILPSLKLSEGADVRVFSGEEILLEPRVTPYDRWAIWLNEAQGRLSVAAPTD